MSYRPLKVVVALDDGIDSETVRQALPGPGELELLEVAVHFFLYQTVLRYHMK